MRIVTGILMIIGAVLLAVIAIGAIQWEAVIPTLVRSLPPLLLLLLAFFLGFWGYRILRKLK